MRVLEFASASRRIRSPDIKIPDRRRSIRMKRGRGEALFFVMKFLMHLSKLFVRDMSIYLGGGDGRVAEERLHRADIGAVAEKVGGIRMP